MLLSTSGNFTLPNNQSGTDEHILLWHVPAQEFTAVNEDPTFYLGNGDLWGLATGSNSVSYFMMQKAFTSQGYRFAAGDVMEHSEVMGTPRLLWDASEHGFPRVDAIEVILP